MHVHVEEAPHAAGPGRVCSDPRAIDAAWMTEALEESGVARGATVTSLDFCGFIGTGQTGCNVRYGLTWDRPEGRPASVVGKFPSQDPAARASAFVNGSYEIEAGFYGSLARTLDVRTPACYAVRIDPDAQDFVLLLEDLAGSRQGDQLVGLTVDEAALAVQQAVALHAPRWGDVSLAGAGPSRLQGIDRAARLVEFYALTLEPSLAQLHGGLDDDVVQLCHDFQPLAGAWVTALAEAPGTVVHADFRPDNLMFGVEPGAPPLAVVDWQTCTTWAAMVDLAYLVGGCFEPDQRAAVEQDLLRDYHQRLVAAGIDQDRAVLERDYRLASLWGVAMTVMATTFAARTERGDAMLTVMAQRHGRHALDLEALDLLR